jgi:hypothetical protein
LHASRGAYTFQKKNVLLLNGMYQYFHHIDISIQYVEVKEIIGVDSNSGDKIFYMNLGFLSFLEKSYCYTNV